MSGENSSAYLFLDAVQDSFSTQHVTECTRHRQGQYSSLLDLVFSSNPTFIDEVTNLSALGSSDYDCLLWKYKCCEEPPVSSNDTPKLNYRRGDYTSMNDHFRSINWSDMNSDSIQKNWDAFQQLVQNAVTHFVPTTTYKPKNSPPGGPKVCLK